jgi:hypothetical protein
MNMKTGKLSTLTLLGILCALIATAIYEEWIPHAWVGGPTRWPWLLFATGAPMYFVCVLVRLWYGEKWS